MNLKKLERYLQVNRPLSYKKRIYRAAVSQRLRNTGLGLLSDGGAFKYTSFSKRMEHNNVRLLPAETLPGKPLAVPFVFVANDPFALSVNIIKPYARQTSTNLL